MDQKSYFCHVTFFGHPILGPINGRLIQQIELDFHTDLLALPATIKYILGWKWLKVKGSCLMTAMHLGEGCSAIPVR